MPGHALLAAKMNLQVYFADAHSPWKMGAIESANGLPKQYQPKGSNLVSCTPAPLNEMAEKQNHRLRECADLKTPNEVWAALVAKTLH